MRKALFLDRDGVVNIDKGYVFRREDIEFVQGIFELCRYAKQNRYLLIVVTNQSGIARGFYSEEQFQMLMAWMKGVFESEGCPIDAVYHCPYLDNHPMRKPNPGMILQAASDFNLDLGASILIGDKLTDIEAAERAGVGRSYLV